MKVKSSFTFERDPYVYRVMGGVGEMDYCALLQHGRSCNKFILRSALENLEIFLRSVQHCFFRL